LRWLGLGLGNQAFDLGDPQAPGAPVQKHDLEEVRRRQLRESAREHLSRSKMDDNRLSHEVTQLPERRREGCRAFGCGRRARCADGPPVGHAAECILVDEAARGRVGLGRDVDADEVGPIAAAWFLRAAYAPS
jgi:hypothetical protein